MKDGNGIEYRKSTEGEIMEDRKDLADPVMVASRDAAVEQLMKTQDGMREFGKHVRENKEELVDIISTIESINIRLGNIKMEQIDESFVQKLKNILKVGAKQ